MPASAPQPSRSSAATIAEQAALWLARRDRGLTPEEQDDYMQWLAADPRHAEAVTQHAAAFERMMTLYEWQPGHSAEPNPDLFAPPRRWGRRLAIGSMAAAAALVLAGIAWWRGAEPRAPVVAQKSYLRVNERQALPDGSIVELKDGSRITAAFSAAERRVTLSGEAHFNVSKDPGRPFVVEADGVAVRAVGTAFNVRIEPDAVEVLVTEGSVRVQPANQDAAGAPLVSARQRAVVNRAAAEPPQIVDATPAEIADALAWQAPRLQFFETPLGDAVAEFNQRNRTQIILADPGLKTVLIGGTFRVDNVEGFLRLLEKTLDLRAEPRSPGVVALTRAR